jgi:hypothetical protein
LNQNPIQTEDRPVLDQLIEAAIDSCPENDSVEEALARQFGEMLCSDMCDSLERIKEHKELDIAMAEYRRKAERTALKNELQIHMEAIVEQYAEDVIEDDPDASEEALAKVLLARMTDDEREIYDAAARIAMEEMIEDLAAQAEAARRQMSLPLGDPLA